MRGTALLVALWVVGWMIWYTNYSGVLREPHMTGDERVVLLLDLLVGLVATPVVLLRHRWPRAVAAVELVAAGVSSVAFPASWLAVAHLAERRRTRETAVASIVMVVGACLNPFWLLDITGGHAFGSVLGRALVVLLIEGVLCAVVVTIGRGVGARRELLASLRREADLARREQSARVAQAQLAERTRIAREMHDVVAHRISLVSLHAGALAYQADLTDEERQHTAEVIRDNAHRALEELRSVLGVLRDETAVTPGESTGTAPPQPDIAAIDRLIDDELAAGTKLTVQISNDFRDLSETTGRNLIRIAQECLTNARKHAPGMPVVLKLAGCPTRGVLLEVRNVCAPEGSGIPGAGMGLAGLQERAALAGGHLTAGAEGDEFVVHATIPWSGKMGA